MTFDRSRPKKIEVRGAEAERNLEEDWADRCIMSLLMRLANRLAGYYPW